MSWVDFIWPFKSKKRELLDIFEDMDRDISKMFTSTHKPFLRALQTHLKDPHRVRPFLAVLHGGRNRGGIFIRQALSTLEVDMRPNPDVTFTSEEIIRGERIAISWILKTALFAFGKASKTYAKEFHLLRPDLENVEEAARYLEIVYLDAVSYRSIRPEYRAEIQAMAGILKKAHGK